MLQVAFTQKIQCEDKEMIKGAKAGQQQQRQPVIAKDSAASISYLKILYGLSEGEISGLADGAKSIYLDDTPLIDDSGNPMLPLDCRYHL